MDDPLESRPMRDRAYDLIQQKILNGELPAGAALSEVALARELGTSRTPIREAIGQLIAEGFLEQIPNRGAVVMQFGRVDIVELYELREVLEVHAVRKAAQGEMTDSERAHLRQIVTEPLGLVAELEASGASLLDASQMQRFMAADLAFHTLLILAVRNRRIQKVLNDTRLLIRIFGIRHEGHSAAQLIEIHRQHSLILDALFRGDAEAAAQFLSYHIRGSRHERLNAYDEWERNRSLRWMRAPATTPDRRFTN